MTSHSGSRSGVRFGWGPSFLTSTSFTDSKKPLLLVGGAAAPPILGASQAGQVWFPGSSPHHHSPPLSPPRGPSLVP